MNNNENKSSSCFFILDADLVQGGKNLNPIFLCELVRIKEKAKAFLYAYTNKNDHESLDLLQKNLETKGLKIDRIIFDSCENAIFGCLDEMNRITSQEFGFLFFTRTKTERLFTPAGICAISSFFNDVDEEDPMLARLNMTKALDKILPPSGFAHYDKCTLIDNKPFVEVEVRIKTPEALQHKKKPEPDGFDDYNYFKSRLRFDIDYNLYELTVIRVEFESCRMIDWSYTEGEAIYTGELVTGHTMLNAQELNDIIAYSKPAMQYQIDLFS